MILPVGALAVKPRNRNRFSVIKDIHSSEQLSEDFIACSSSERLPS